MNELAVRFAYLEPMHVASVTARAEDAEAQSWKRLKAWAEPKGLLTDPSLRVFGYDNCQPHPNHQYTTWIPVEGAVQGDGDIRTLDFPGGWYAVTTVQGVEAISPSWHQLADWLKTSPYNAGPHQTLEELVGMDEGAADTITIHLYLPIDRPPQDQSIS